MSHTVRLTFAGLALFFILFPLTLQKPGLPQDLKSDEPPYYLMALSLVHDFDLLCETKNIQRLTNEFPYNNANNLILMTDDGWRNVYFGKPYLISLVATPLVRLFGADGFVATNMALLLPAQVTGERFEDYLEREVFKRPLGLNKSPFDYTDTMALYMSKGHNGDMEMSRLDNEDKPASGLFSTLKDLTIFLKFLSSSSTPSTEGINNNKIIDSIIKNANPAIDTFYDNKNIYSSGWYLNSYQFKDIHTVLSSSGNINGFSTAITYIPEERLGIVILTNSSLGWKANMDIIARGLRGIMDVFQEPCNPEP